MYGARAGTLVRDTNILDSTPKTVLGRRRVFTLEVIFPSHITRFSQWIIPAPPPRRAAMSQSTGPPHFLWQEVSPLGPQFPTGCLKFLPAPAGLLPLTFGFAFSPPPAPLTFGPLLNLLRARSPSGHREPHFPGRLHQFSAARAPGPIPPAWANSTRLGQFHPPVTAPRANPRYVPPSGPHITQSRTCFSLGPAP